jgi:GNAT superfamily N-acetyltransferase
MKRALEEDSHKEVVLGKVDAIKVKESEHYHLLYDELEAEYDRETRTGFHNNRNWILEAFVERRLYTLTMRETPSMFAYQGVHPLFLHKSGGWRLPCLCVVAKGRWDTVEILWVAKRARCQGFGSALIAQLEVRYVLEIVNESHRFWEKCGVEEVPGLKMSFKQITQRTVSDEEEDEESCHTLTSSSEDEEAEAPTHRVINPYFFSSIHHVMSPSRIECQKFKAQLRGFRLCTHPLYYGQFVGEEEDLARNRVLLIARPHYDAKRDGPERLEKFRREVEAHDLRLHAESITLGESPATLIVVMDTGVNEAEAVAFAHTLDCEEVQ